MEVPLSTETYGDKIFPFYAVAYDANGFLLDTDNVSWSLDFGFSAVEGDDSRLVHSVQRMEIQQTLHFVLHLGAVSWNLYKS